MMQPNQIDTITAQHALPTVSQGHDPSMLTSIYEDRVNIAIWQRRQQEVLDLYAREWAERYPAHTPRLVLSVATASDQIAELLPDLSYKETFQHDIALLVDMFACLFDTLEVGLRLTPLAEAMCPRFHVDNIPCRLVTSYGGLGTEWLLEENINRNRLGRGAKGLADNVSGIYRDDKAIKRLGTQHVALLKGSGWEGNEDYGLVHRSPYLPSGQSRLLLTLDFS